MKDVYTKQSAVKTHGLAILSMLILHLFCRQGTDVYGTPLLWVSKDIPLVYYFGFFAEICVPLYSLSAGYAQQLLYEKSASLVELWKSNIKRALKLLINYWIILILFSLLALIFPSDGTMPGSAAEFFKSIVLIHSYNGAWWYLNVYILLMIISPAIILFPCRKLTSLSGLIFCFIFQMAYSLAARLGLWPSSISQNSALSFVWIQITNFVSVLPCFWAGAFIRKGNYFNKLNDFLQKHYAKNKNSIILMIFAALFLFASFTHKAILMPVIGIIVFLLFNVMDLSKVSSKIFLFLGKHSTNIWLTHMFFYICVFGGTVQLLRYPLFMLVGLIAICVICSYVINFILKKIYKVLSLSL